MPTYTFRCPNGHGDHDVFLTFAERDSIQGGICEWCHEEGLGTVVCPQVFTPPRIQRSSLRTEATYDHSLGGIVTDQHSREELAKRKSEAEGRSIVFVDPQDTKALGVSDEGLDATRRQKRDTGQTEGTKHFV